MLNITLAGDGVTFALGAENFYNFNTGEDYTVVTGTGGDDVIADSFADDSIIGGEGGDTLTSNFGADTLLGGLGADRISLAENSDVAVIDGGGGLDTLTLYDVSDLSSASISNIETLHFQSGSTTFAKAQISGKNFTITSESSPANMIVAGTTNDDTVDLGALDLSGFGKTLTVNASDGDDRILAGANMSDGSHITAIDGGDGDDTLTMFNTGDASALDNVSSVENVFIGDVSTTINLGSTLADSGATATIDASAMTGNNTLTFTGAAGNAYHIIGGGGRKHPVRRRGRYAYRRGRRRTPSTAARATIRSWAETATTRSWAPPEPTPWKAGSATTTWKAATATTT